MQAIRSFHNDIRKLAAGNGEDEQCDVGCFKLSQIANMDQTPLPFSFTNGDTYADTGDKTVWIRGGALGMDKRQCTVQLTLFADREARVKLLVIFKGQGRRIPFREKVRFDPRVRVTFQPKAWCDEAVMQEWLQQQWKSACDGNMLLVLEVHKAQKTDGILHRLNQCSTTPVYVPAGTTGLVQPVDVVFNAPFKAAVDRLATAHVQENLQDYVRGSIPAGERRVLFTKWIGQAWKKFQQRKRW